MQKTYALLITLLCFTLLQSGTLMATELVAVKKDNVNMRSGPSTKKKVLWKLGEGFPLKVLKRSGKWLRVEDFEGTVGWVHKSVVNRSRHMIVKVYKKSKKTINVRRDPTTKSQIVAKAYYGVVFKTLDQKKGWVKIRHDKITGWVKRTLLWGF
ncbi:MAG: peptide-binding protein [Candidatus Electrothrix sp. AR3]|nr:peptide-binding protein [Candidatus Electrothrix sp. AR3]